MSSAGAMAVRSCVDAKRRVTHFTYPHEQELMTITQQDVDRIARLAYLKLTPDQTARTQSEFSEIVTLIQQLQSVSTEGVTPMEHPLSGHQNVVLRLRDDVARPAATPEERDALMANAPATADGLFLVPTVIE